MESKLLQILNEELMELKNHTRLAEQRLDLQCEELNRHNAIFDQHSEMLSRHQSGFEILFSNMQKMEERMNLELKKLKNSK